MIFYRLDLFQVSPNDFSESPDYNDSDYPPPPPPPEHMRSSYSHHHTSILDQTISDQPFLHSQMALANSHVRYSLGRFQAS